MAISKLIFSTLKLKSFMVWLLSSKLIFSFDKSMISNENDINHQWHMHLLGDHAIVFSLNETMDLRINLEVHALNQFIQNKKINAFKDFIPAYHTLTVVYDIVELQVLLNQKNKEISLNEFAQSFIKEFIQLKQENTSFELNTKTIKVPVCYDLDFGIDLEKIAKEKNKSIEEIIQIHCSKTYRVFCLGFMPSSH